MVLWTKLWFFTENYGTSIYDGKNMVDYQNLRNFDYNGKTMVIYQNDWVFKQIYGFKTLIYYEKTMVLWKKL